MGKKLIIIAEDEIAYAELLKEQLTREGYRVLLTPNGDEALKLIRKQKPVLFLLDIIMPIKSGLEVLSIMRKDSELKDVNVVVLSNLGQDEDLEKVKHLGVNTFIIKSDENFFELIDKIKKLAS